MKQLMFASIIPKNKYFAKSVMFNLYNLTKNEKYFGLAFLLGFLFKYNYLTLHIINVPSITGAVLKNIVFVLIIVFFLFPLLKVKRGQIFLILILLLFTLLFIANLWYNRHFGNFLSFTDIAVGEDIGSLKVLYRHIAKFWDVIFIIDLFILGLLITRINKISQKLKVRLKDIIAENKKKLQIGAISCFALLFVQTALTNFLLENERPHNLYNRSTPGFVNVYGLLPLYFYDFSTHLTLAGTQPERVEKPYALEEHKKDGQKITADYSNIIVLQVESLDEKLINYEHNNQELTPFLNELKKDSLYAENFYAQHVNGSFDADFSFLTSLYPVNRNYAFKENDMTQFDSLVKELNNKGYQTLAFHNNDKSFFHRDKAYPELGFDKFYSRQNFSAEDRVIDMEEGYLGINDYDFFKQSLDYLEEAEDPFFAYMITVTSHTPFTFYPSEYTQEAYKDIQNQLVHDFFQSISFVDKSLEMFFQELEERGLKEDTLFIIYSDHDAAIDTPEYTSGIEFELDRNIKHPEHIPLFIKHPDIEPGILEKTGTFTDLAPTILDILGAQKRPQGFVGQSLLQGEESPVLFIHDLPQVLYQDQLFVKEFGQLEKTGHIKGRQKDVQFSEQQKQQKFETIQYMRDLMQYTRRQD